MSDEQEAVLDPRDVTIWQQAETIRQQADRLKQLEDEVQRLLALLKGKADSKAAKKPVFKENYRLDRNKNKKKKLKRKSTGRKPTRNKRDLATQVIDIYAAGVARNSLGESSTAKPFMCATRSTICPTRPACRCRQDYETVVASSVSRSF